MAHCVYYFLHAETFFGNWLFARSTFPFMTFLLTFMSTLFLNFFTNIPTWFHFKPTLLRSLNYFLATSTCYLIIYNNRTVTTCSYMTEQSTIMNCTIQLFITDFQTHVLINIIPTRTTLLETLMNFTLLFLMTDFLTQIWFIF